MKKIVVYIFLISVFLLSFQSVSAANIAVHPGQSIQKAVDSASDGDNITVYDNNKNPYTYKESITIDKKVFIKASGSVTIEAKNSNSSVFTINPYGAGSSIQSFILTKSNYNVLVNNANNCLISGNKIISTSLVGIQFYGDINGSKVNKNKITGVDPSVGNGISFEYGTCTYNSITSNVIGNFLNGILFNNVSYYNTVYNNTISCTGYHGAGIYATDSSGNMAIKYNKVTGAEDGIAIQQLGNGLAQYYTITHNTLQSNKNGFWIILSDSIIDYNTATYNKVSGMDITGTNNDISYNSAVKNGNCGITLCRYGDYDSNYVYNNYLASNKAGINSASNGTTITSNTVISNTANGIISTANNDKIVSNSVKNNNGSAILFYGLCNSVRKNYISGNVIGILINNYSSSDRNDISSNTIFSNGNGINSASWGSSFSNNNIKENKQTGLTITGSNCNIFKNCLKYNGAAGITVTGTGNIVTQNSIYNNLYGATFNNGNAAVFNFNRVVGNKYQMYICSTPSALNALNNWWGSNSAPTGIYGSINVKTWLVLTISSIIKNNDNTYSVVADLSHNSAGADISTQGHMVDGTLVTFTSTQGSIGSPGSTVNGTATVVFKPSTGIKSSTTKISAVYDGQTVSKTINT